jgi:DNA-binding transcriptional ArsR family regulator
MSLARAALTALADPTRRQLLDCLRQGPKTVGEIAAFLPVSRPAVSQHLKLMKSARLVEERRQGRRHYFAIDPAAIAELRGYCDAILADLAH